MDGRDEQGQASRALLAHLLGMGVGAGLILGLTLLACLLLRTNFR
ncbi:MULTISPECIES: hypothetical protein [Pseudomonas]|nr:MULTISPECIES: hypothetical protein [Pseudomonas]BBP75627.1 hypothetical protein PHLH7_17310 [Pseudomonas sp. Ost2]